MEEERGDEKIRFPENFYWGAATSAHQVEGGNHNDWSEWELKNSERLAREARSCYGGLKNWPEIQAGAENPANYISGKACDHYNRFREDFDIAKSLGHNAHRFSIEWSRIEPEEGKFDEKEIEHYREVIHALRERGMEPFVTLWHWTLPSWVCRQGGWENVKTIGDFARYTDRVTQEFQKEIKFWIPLNEPTVFVGHGYVLGLFPPNIKSYRRGHRVLNNLIEAHKRVYGLIHAKSQKALVGSSHNLHYHAAYQKWNPLDILATKILDYVRDLKPLRKTSGYEDFIGLNYYYRDCVRFSLWGGKFGLIDIKNPNTEISDMGWNIAPEGIYHAIKKLKKYRRPIYITENGVADAEDTKRKYFIYEHLNWISKAINEGTDVRGYFHWSLLDNFEWDKGFWPRFGLVEVDYKTMERKVRASAFEYKKIIETSGENINI